MKATKLTYNNFKNWHTQSQYWQMLNEKLNDKNWNRDIQFADFHLTIPRKNILWGKIAREFKAIFGDEFKLYANIDLYGNKVKDEDRYITTYIYIHTSIYSTLQTPSISFTLYNFGKDREKRYELIPPKNMEFTKENVLTFVKNWINKELLLPAGYYRDAQIIYKMEKKDFIEAFKNNIQKDYIANAVGYDLHEVKKAIKRNLGLIFNDFMDIDFIKKAVNQIGTRNKGKKPLPVYQFDTYDLLHNDCDDLENSFYDEVEKQGKEAILIY